MAKWREIITNWDDEIKAARFENVRRELAVIATKNIPRPYRLAAANAARRVQRFSTAIKILYPIVRKNETNSAATPSEVAEYAASLMRIGSVLEARTLLIEIGNPKPPEAVLILAFAEIVEWNYAQAGVLLKSYLNLPGITSYQAMVAKVNLVASLIFSGEYLEALTLLNELLAESQKSDLKLLYANCLSLLVQTHFQVGEFDLVRKTIDLARQAVPQEYELHHLHLDKWECFSEAHHRQNLDLNEQLNKIKTRAHLLKDYETVRDCDFGRADFLHDENAFLSYYFGTMPKSQKPKTRTLDFAHPNFCEVYRMKIGQVRCRAEFSPEALDMTHPIGLKPGQALHRFLAALNQDFYRPQTPGALFQAVFPSTYYDPYSAPNRIHQLTKRLQNWIVQCDLDCQIQSGRGLFEFRNPEKLSVRLPYGHQEKSWSSIELNIDRLRKSLNSETFTFEDLRKQCDLSRNQAYEFLQKAIENKWIVREGNSRYSEYRLLK